MRFEIRLTSLTIVAAVLFFMPQLASAQSQASLALECFVEANRTGTLVCDPNPTISVGEVMLNPDEHPVDLVQEIAQGLQELATSDPSRRLRIAAVNWLALKGERSEVHSVRTIDELDEIYSRSRFGDVRMSIASRMHLQLARDRAVSFLEKAANASPVEEASSEWPSAYVAINTLTRMGEDGRQALRRLSAAETVKNPVAKGYLEHLAADDFRTSQE
jgi:hypothetical protein